MPATVWASLALAAVALAVGIARRRAPRWGAPRWFALVAVNVGVAAGCALGFR